MGETKNNNGEKIWGWTTPLIVTPMFELHRLEIKPWHRCSWHTHKFKHNAFVVISGALSIDSHGAWSADRLGVGRVLTVPPGILHQFRTGESACVALEMYYTEPLSEDIIRMNVGGPVEH